MHVRCPPRNNVNYDAFEEENGTERALRTRARATSNGTTRRRPIVSISALGKACRSNKNRTPAERHEKRKTRRLALLSTAARYIRAHTRASDARAPAAGLGAGNGRKRVYGKRFSFFLPYFFREIIGGGGVLITRRSREPRGRRAEGFGGGGGA